MGAIGGTYRVLTMLLPQVAISALGKQRHISGCGEKNNTCTTPIVNTVATTAREPGCATAAPGGVLARDLGAASGMDALCLLWRHPRGSVRRRLSCDCTCVRTT